MFKTGFCYVFGPDDLETALPRLAALGYDGVEFWDDLLTEVDRRRGIDYLADLLRHSGLSCAQICPYFDFVDGPESWEKSIQVGERYLRWAITLGRPLIRIFTGKLWGKSVVGSANATAEQWDAAIRGIQHLCDLAAPHGVRLALECHRGSLMDQSDSTLRLLEGVNRLNLGVNLQVPLEGEASWYSLERLGRYTVHVHAHNWVVRSGRIELTFLADGELNYPRFLRRLMGFGFDGYVSIEHPDHGGRHDPWETAEVEGRYLAALKRELARQASLPCCG